MATRYAVKMNGVTVFDCRSDAAARAWVQGYQSGRTAGQSKDRPTIAIEPIEDSET